MANFPSRDPTEKSMVTVRRKTVNRVDAWCEADREEEEEEEEARAREILLRERGEGKRSTENTREAREGFIWVMQWRLSLIYNLIID